jgi:hypothetical protein
LTHDTLDMVYSCRRGGGLFSHGRRDRPNGNGLSTDGDVSSAGDASGRQAGDCIARLCRASGDASFRRLAGHRQFTGRANVVLCASGDDVLLAGSRGADPDSDVLSGASGLLAAHAASRDASPAHPRRLGIARAERMDAGRVVKISVTSDRPMRPVARGGSGSGDGAEEVGLRPEVLLITSQ